MLLRQTLSLPVLALLLIGMQQVQAQCDPTVPVFTVDLTASPSSTWMSPSVQRNGLCCGATAPDRCLQFIITLHPNAQGINFDICEGAVPPGALFYQIGCGPPVQVGQPICLNGPGPHTLTFCKPGNNTNRYCITSVPGPTAGPDLGLNDGCTGTLTSNGFAPGTVLWTSIEPGATGSYDNYLACATCANTAVTAQAGFPSFVDYRVCGLALAPCSQTQYCDTVRVWFFPTLAATIVPAQPTVCFGAAGTTITVLGSGGTPPYTYAWSNGATTQSIFVGPGTYTVLLSDTSQCPPTSASVIVTSFTQPIQAFAGTDIVVCSTSSSATLNGQVTGASGGQWTSGTGGFSPNATTLNATYTATPAEVADGFVDLVLETTGNGTCPGDADTIRVYFDPGVVSASATSTNATCNGASNGTASATPNTPGLSYQWNDPAAQTTANATGLPAGTYTVTITTALGCTALVSATINEPAAVSIASLNTTPETCAGMQDGAATVSITGGTQPYAYSWSTGAQGPSITAGAGSYSVSITDANGCAPAQGSATIVVNGLPNSANAGPDLVGCMDQLPITLQGTVTNATGGQWSGGTGIWSGTGLSVQYMPSTAEILAGSTTLTLTTVGNNACPPATDQVTMMLSNAFVNATLVPTPVNCAGGSDGSASFLPVSPGLSFVWQPPVQQTGPVATGLSAGSYGVTATDLLGCAWSLQTTISEPAPLQAAITAITGVSCVGANNGTASVGPSGGTAPYIIVWSPSGQIGTTASSLAAGTHITTVTDAHGCSTQVSALIGSPAPLALQAQVPDTVCVNSPQVLLAWASGGQGPLQVSWGGLGTGSPLSYSFTASQQVTVTVTDSLGCTGPLLSFPVTVLNLNNALLTTSPPQTLCPGGIASVSAGLSNYPGAYTMSWPTLGQQGNGPFNVPLTQSTAVPVIVQDACGNWLTDTIPLTLEVPPTIVLPELIASGCAPLTVQFPAGLTTQPVTYNWSLGNGSTSTQAAPVVTYPAGNFTASLVVTTLAGCSASATGAGAIIAHPRPHAAFSASPWSTDIDHSTISFTDASTGGPTDWHWSFGDGATAETSNTSHTYGDVGAFPVELWIIDANGCADSVTRTVRITPVYDITIPNIFTPVGQTGGYWIPGDLSNDTFYPFVRFVKDYRMRIFNRWGELIFESDDLPRGWDGWYRGTLSAQDVYVYQVWVRFIDDKEALRMGDVTLMR